MKQYAVVYFPRINLEQLNIFREKYDPMWKIINPHITLVFPISEISEEKLITHLECVTKETKSFPIELNGLIKSFDDYLFLQIKEGNENVINLHNKLYSGILIPFIQKNITFIPHLTIGYFRTTSDKFNKELFEQAYLEGEKMKIYIEDNLDNITLIKGDGLNPATIIKTFKLK